MSLIYLLGLLFFSLNTSERGILPGKRILMPLSESARLKQFDGSRPRPCFLGERYQCANCKEIYRLELQALSCCG